MSIYATDVYIILSDYLSEKVNASFIHFKILI